MQCLVCCTKPILDGMVHLDGMVLDGMVQVECLVSCTDKLYEMRHNCFWLDE
jgi:hypothetical protein